MSDSIETPEAATPVASPDLASLQGENQILASKLAEMNSKLGEASQQLASVLRERDSFKDAVGKLEPKAKLADELQLKVEGFVNQGRESAILEKLRAQLPGAEVLALQGVVSKLHESGRVNRYSDDSAAESKKIFELIKTEAPSLMRQPTMAGGTAAVRETPAPSRMKSLLWGT